MANKQRGEVAFTVDGERYTLHLSTNAMCEIESAFNGASIQTVFANLDAGEAGVKITDMRTVMRCMLGDNHPGITDKETGKLMDALGDDAGKLIGEAIQIASPEDKKSPGELKAATAAA